MCEIGRLGPRRGRPRWGRLYAIAGFAIAALLAIEFLARAPALRQVLRYGVVMAAFAAMLHWVRANGVELDLAEWCACAPSTLSIRVVPSSAADRRPMPSSGTVLAPVAAASTAPDESSEPVTLSGVAGDGLPAGRVSSIDAGRHSGS
jgi:hypothetical protein